MSGSSNKKRVIAILQLCFAFSFLSWSLIQPYMNQYFTYHSQLSLYKTVMGHEDLMIKMDPQIAVETAEKLKRNAIRFAKLPKEQQVLIEQKVDNLKDPPFLEKMKHSLYYLCFEVNPFATIWMILAITISIFLLLGVEGAGQAAYLLPAVIFFFGISSYFGKPVMNTAKSQFPSEQYLMQHYVKEPLHGSFSEKKEQLLNGWENYLATEWASDNAGTSIQQRIEEGEYRFNIALIRSGELPKKELHYSFFSFLLIPFYFLWNLFFAYTMKD